MLTLNLRLGFKGVFYDPRGIDEYPDTYDNFIANNGEEIRTGLRLKLTDEDNFQRSQDIYILGHRDKSTGAKTVKLEYDTKFYASIGPKFNGGKIRELLAKMTPVANADLEENKEQNRTIMHIKKILLTLLKDESTIIH